MWPEAIKAMASMKNKNIFLVIGGFGTLEEKIRSTAEKTNNVKFLGRVPSDQVMDHTSSADIVLCMFNPEDLNNRLGTPNKLFEAMAAGKPIILSRSTLGAKIGRKEGFGLSVPYTVKGFHSAITELHAHPERISQMGKKGRYAAKRKYNWERMSSKLIRAYSKLI